MDFKEMNGMYDIHTHILPGVDDGASSVRDALELLKKEYEDGVRNLFLTPHYRKDMFEPSRKSVKEYYDFLKIEVANTFPDMRIMLGCEFHACMDMVEIIAEHPMYTMGDTRCVLVEFSHYAEWRYVHDRCQELLFNGYQPIIAHVERCQVLRKDISLIERLVDMNILIQVNAESILGNMGFGIRLFCKKLMKNGLLHFIASDAHDMKSRKPLLGDCVKTVEKQMGKEYAKQIFVHNPKYYLEKGI